MKPNLRSLALILIINLNSLCNGSTIEQNTGFDFTPIAFEIEQIFYYTQNMTTILPQLVSFLPELQIITNQVPNANLQKAMSSYITTVLGLVIYLYYTTSDSTAQANFLTLISNDINYILPNAQYIAQVIPQIYNTLQQLQLVDSNINVTNTSSTQDKLAYIAMIIGFLTYFVYFENPY